MGPQINEEEMLVILKASYLASKHLLNKNHPNTLCEGITETAPHRPHSAEGMGPFLHMFLLPFGCWHVLLELDVNGS